VWSGRSRNDKFVNKYGISQNKMPDRNIVWHDIQHEMAEKLWDIHLHDSMSSQCREYLLNFLGTDIEFSQKEKVISPSSEFHRILKAEWAPFISDIFDTLFILGIVPVTFQKSQINPNDYIPKVPKRGTYRIQIAYILELESLIFRVLRPIDYFYNPDKNTSQKSNKNRKNHSSGISFTFMNALNPFSKLRHFKTSGFEMLGRKFKSDFLSNMPQNWILDRNTIVLHGFGYDPSIRGELCSRLMTILEYSESTDMQKKIMEWNQMRLFSRPLFIQSVEPTDPSKNKPDVSFTSTVKKKEDAKKRRFEEEKEELYKTMAEYQGKNIAEIFNTSSYESRQLLDEATKGSISRILVGDELPPITIGPLPQGYNLPTGQKPDITLGMKYFELEENLKERKAAAYGIPLQIIQNNTSVRSNTAAQIELFHHTIKNWMRNINEILTVSYNAIYGNEDKKGFIAQYLERYTHDKNMMDKIKKQIIEDWQENDGETTLFQNKDLHKKMKKNIDSEKSDEDTKDSKKSKKSSKKRSREKKASLESDSEYSDSQESKRLRVNEFDPNISLFQDHDETQERKKKILSNLSDLEPVEMKLAISSSLMLDMLAYIYTQGALLDEEYFSALRNRIDYPIDNKIIKKLEKQKEKNLGLDQPGASQSKSKSKDGKSKSKAKPAASKAKPKEKTPSGLPKEKSSMEGGEGRGREKDLVKEKKKKMDSSMSKATETNAKREMSADKVQKTNAKKGKKND